MRRLLLWISLTVITLTIVSVVSVTRRGPKPTPGSATGSAPELTTTAPPIASALVKPTVVVPAVIGGIQPQVLEQYRAEAKVGDAAAQDNLAVCYEQGLGLPADPVQAAVWYQKSAAQGFAPAQYHLGECFEHGRGVSADLTQAIDLYRRAAKSGLGQAQTALTRLGSPIRG